MKFKTTIASLATRQFSAGSLSQPSFTYTLPSSSSVYVPLTSHCNSQSLPETRGPSFALPAVVVAALCRVRDAEVGSSQWEPWCRWLDIQEGSHQLPPRKDIDVTTNRPTIEELLSEIDSLDRDVDRVVIAGEGEPTLRMEPLLRFMQELHNRNIDIRVNTNGLVPSPEPFLKVAKECQASLSVALMTADFQQYDELMLPVSDGGHECVVQFIQSAVQLGIKVETTAVERVGVDKISTEQLATDLGTRLRWRPYFQ